MTLRLTIAGLLAVLATTAVTSAQEGTYELQDGRWVRQAEPAKGTPAGEIALIRQYLREGDEGDALEAAEQFLQRYPDHPARETAMHLAGQAELSRGRYFAAYKWYRRQIETFPAGELSDRALRRQYRIGAAFLGGRKRRVWGFLPFPAKQDGAEILLRVVEQAPGSDTAARALLRLGTHYRAEGDYASAIDVYDQFLRMYAQTHEAAPEAMLAAARASYAMFEGIRYDETPLLEAEQRYRQFAAAYPERAEEANVAAILDEIQDTKAEKTYRTGRFYERVDRPEAAGFYYRQVIQQQPESRWAEQARTELRRLGMAVTEPEGAER